MDQGGLCGQCWNKLPFLTEPYCSICSYQLGSRACIEDPICASCIKKLPKFDKAYSLLHYNDKSKYLIFNFKYHDDISYNPIFANLLVSRYRQEIEDSDLVVPIPMHKYKRLWRMYNHSQILAEEIAHLLEIEINSNILLKVRNTRPQTALSKEIRAKNLVGSIDVRNGKKVRNRKILLIDDVMTTGSTANICASKLKKAGAKEVKVLCIARRMLDNT